MLLKLFLIIFSISFDLLLKIELLINELLDTLLSLEIVLYLFILFLADFEGFEILLLKKSESVSFNELLFRVFFLNKFSTKIGLEFLISFSYKKISLFLKYLNLIFFLLFVSLLLKTLLLLLIFSFSMFFLFFFLIFSKSFLIS